MAHGLWVSVLSQCLGTLLLFLSGMGESSEPSAHTCFAVELAYLLCFPNQVDNRVTGKCGMGLQMCLWLLEF